MIMMWFSASALRRALLVAFPVSTLAVVIGCGGGATDQDSLDESEPIDETAINVIGDRVEISAWTRPSSEFSYDQFIAAGWKQYQIYDVDTLPNALEARYGFFNRKDVEIASH